VQVTDSMTAERVELRARLVPPVPGSAFWGWAGPVLVTALGAVLRFYRLGVPHAVVFDETYYVPDAWSILRHGVEINHFSDVNKLLARGSTHILMGTQGEYVAHPPLGKIMIAAGEWLFGLTPFGWRFSAAVVGTLAILMVARITRRMTRSTVLGCVAGLLLAVDGLEFVLSRTAILDIFVMFWVLAAFGLLLIDRDRTRVLLADAAAAGPDGNARPRLGVRWLLVLAGVCLGCACAVKWNGIWYLVAFAALVVTWDIGAHRAAGLDWHRTRVLRRDAVGLPAWFGLAPLAAYVVSWAGWFATSYGYDRNGMQLNDGRAASTLISWLQYQKSMLGFGLGLSTYQTYKSNPLGWLILARPMSFYSLCAPHGNACGTAPQSTEQEVLAIGTPLIWWAGAIALVACIAWWLARRDWRPGVVVAGIAAGWLPWIWFYWHDHRTEFYYYAVVFEPFLVIGITLCLGLIAGQVGALRGRRGRLIVGGYLLAVVADFYFMYPVLAAQVLPFHSWLDRMWFGSWI
jgi:dolichyl-phosphate-mannose-protein mannosyltransferase